MRLLRRAPRSVSYTHLDVYKRQAMALLRSGVDINTIRIWLGPVSLQTTHIYAESDLKMKAKALARCEAVSYTHLDVYKRQITTRPNHPLPRQDFHLQACQRPKAAHRSLLLVSALLYRGCAREGEFLFHRTHSGRILSGRMEVVNRQVFPVCQVLESGLRRSRLFNPIWLGS